MTSLSYPLGAPPATGQAVTVAPGLLWLRMPMPFALDHVNIWAIRDAEAGWALADTGLWSEETVSAWETQLAPGGALGGRPISRMLATHMHSDHVGMAGWLQHRCGSALWMTRLEFLGGRNAIADAHRQAPAEWERFFRRAGWGEGEVDAWRPFFGRYARLMHPLPESYRRLEDGERLCIGDHEWEVVVGRGHSPEHACLYCPSLDVLISGDQILPRITSNVSVHPTEPAADPLADWLQSIEHIRRRVPDSVLVLPAHNEPFVGLHARLDELRDSVLHALQRLRDCLGEPRRAVDVFGALFRRRVTSEPSLLNLATGEAIAHLNHLIRLGEVIEDRQQDEVSWFRRAASMGPAC